MKEIGIYGIIAEQGGGKSAAMAWVIRNLLTKEYPRTQKKYPDLHEREILSNGDITAPYEIKFNVRRWTDPPELKYCSREHCWKSGSHEVHDSDIFIDEIPNIVPAEDWSTVPYWFRNFFSMCRKRSNRIFYSAQRYVGYVNRQVRTQTRFIYMPRIWFKSRDLRADLPPPRWIHGLCVMPLYRAKDLELDPTSENDMDRAVEKKKFVMLKRKLFFLNKKLVSWFDTQQEFPRWTSEKMEEYVQECIEGPNCRDPRHRIKVMHRPI